MAQSFDVQVKSQLVVLGMTISDLARELGLSVPHLSAVIRGDKGLPAEWGTREQYPVWFRKAVLLTLIEDTQQRLGVLHARLYSLKPLGEERQEAWESEKEGGIA